MNKVTQYIIFALIMTFIFSAVMDNFGGQSDSGRLSNNFNYSKFLESVDAGEVNRVLIQGDIIRGQLSDGSGFEVVMPEDPELIDTLINKGVEIEAKQV